MLFKYVVWFGILANCAFATYAIFVNPGQLLSWLGLGIVHSTIWLFNYSVLLVILSCFYIPAASDPLRYRANAWLLIAGRLIPATTFFVGVFMSFMPRGFLLLGVGDGTIGLLELVLLVKVLREADSKVADSEPEERAAQVTYA
jgi:hypothetical protein